MTPIVLEDENKRYEIVADMNERKLIVQEREGWHVEPDPLPDYSVSERTYALEDCWFNIPASSVSRKAHFYEGALAVLRLLGTPETMSADDMVKLARKLTHEARHELRKIAKESTNY